MDRALDVRWVRRRRIRRGLLGGGLLILVALAWLSAPDLFRPSVRRSRIRTGVVDRGTVEAVVQASGTVVPAVETVLSSPVEARVLRILRRPGESLHAGDAILELDTSAVRLELERLTEQRAQKASERQRVALELDRELADLNRRIESKRLDEELLSYRLQQQRQLFAEGLTSEAALRQAEVESRKVEVELRQLQDAAQANERTAAARLEELQLDLSILDRDRDDARRRLELAAARSDRDGVLTWVVEEEGTAVHRGDIVARVADLSSFRVEATVSDAYAPRLAVGLPARVRVGEQWLRARVATIHPTIDNGVMRFNVELDERSHPLLRQNLRVDVSAITEVRDDVLRVPKGPFARGGSAQQVFVLHDGVAVRTAAELGLWGDDYFEIVAGLQEGDEVILSDMESYLHLERVKVK